MANVEAVIYGASNAGGWCENYVTADYNTSKLAEVTYSKPPFVTETKEQIIVDLSGNPEIEETEKFVVNAAFPGNSIVELLDGFEQDVLGYEPKHLFLWTGLTDPVLAIMLLHPNDTRLDKDDETLEAFKKVMTREQDTDGKLRATADFIVNGIQSIIGTAHDNGISTMVGTVPPFASTLQLHENDPHSPMAKHYRREGLTLVGLINDRIKGLGPADPCIIDAYSLVADAATGLVKPEYGFGVSRPEAAGDILHLNSFGQLNVATVFCRELRGKPVTILPPQRNKLETA